MARGLAVLTMLLLNACSPAALLNGLSPQDGAELHRDLAYAPGPRHGFDVYTPKPAPPAPSPVLVFLYGGGWEGGDRAKYRFLGSALAARGVVTVIPDYRVFPEVRFPAFMDDAAQAVAAARAQAASFGGDPRRLFLMGHSAGAQIATLLALDSRYLHRVGLDPQRDIAGVIGLAGPYDFLPLRSATLKTIFGPEADWPRSQPINFVTPGAPPMLLVAGSGDDTVDPANTRRLAAKLRANGDAVQDAIYPRIGHISLIGAFATPLRFLAPVRRDVLQFIHTQVRARDVAEPEAQAARSAGSP